MKLSALFGRWFAMFSTIQSNEICKIIDIKNNTSENFDVCFYSLSLDNINHSICFEGSLNNTVVHLNNDETLQFFPFIDSDNALSVIYHKNIYIVTKNISQFEDEFAYLNFNESLFAIDQTTCVLPC